MFDEEHRSSLMSHGLQCRLNTTCEETQVFYWSLISNNSSAHMLDMGTHGINYRVTCLGKTISSVTEIQHNAICVYLVFKRHTCTQTPAEVLIEGFWCSERVGGFLNFMCFQTSQS